MASSPPGQAPGRGGDRPVRRPPDGTPLYVHLPFCAAKCHYCDFFSVPAEGHDRGAFLDELLREAETRAPLRPSTVFFGGGTPSLLDARELTRVLDTLDRMTGFRASAREVTLECNPESLDRDKAALLLDLGVNRLSIGFQSLDDRVLAWFGRVHDAAASFRAFESARAAGHTNVSVDLIYAIPGQTVEQWRIDLERVLALRPEHFSAYNLTFEEDTLFRRWLEEGRIQRLPDEDELTFLQATREVATGHGYSAYEVSNFASNGRECGHNVNYWRNGPYLGLGPSAVSKVGTKRFGNVRGIGTYARVMRESGAAIDWEDAPSEFVRIAETWWLGLRLSEGVQPDEALRRADATGADIATPVARELTEHGLLVEHSGRYHLSDRGLPLADEIARQFLRAARAAEGALPRSTPNRDELSVRPFGASSSASRAAE